MNDTLNMIQLHPEPRGLIRFLAGQGLNTKTDEDLGYGTHAWLRATFGPHAPQPFRLFLPTQPGRQAKLLGYTPSDQKTLLDHAANFAEPTARTVCDLDHGLAVAAMPEAQAWHSGRRLGFEVLLCPVVREARTGKERDVFLQKADGTADNATLQRDVIYLDWLNERFGGAASLEQGRLEEFRLVQQLRRGARGPKGTRQRARLVRPRVLVRGSLTVRDPLAFAALLARGVGRHRSFGYGMMLMRPAP